MKERIGQMIASRYRIEEPLGSGGVGTVYRAIQEPLHRPVALKMLRPELSGNANVRRRFLREARAVAALSHPNIAMVFDFGSAEDGSLYLALELVHGVPLSEFVPAELPGFPVLRELFDQILAGLAHAHARGVIHHDIKPANVLIARDADGQLQAKIVDFGIATVQGLEATEDEPEGPTQIVGTPHFMAPEQAMGERHLTATVDVYTVGLMLYWCVTGRHAFDRPTTAEVMQAQVSAPMPEIIARPGLQLPDGLDALLRDALAKSPRDRIPSASVLRQRLRAISGAVAGQASWSTPRSTPRPGSPSAAVTAPRPERLPTILEDGPHTMTEEGPLATDPANTGRAAPLLRNEPGRRGAAFVVGRERERERLLDTLFHAFNDQQGMLVTLEGEAGMGKSTLALWLRDQLAERLPIRVGTGAFHRDGERGLRGIREAIESVLETRGMETGQLAAVLAERMVRWGMLEARDHELLTSFLRPRLTAREEEPHALGRLESLRELILRILERASEERPILCIIDDVHWAGPETASLLEYLAAELRQRKSRFVLLATIQAEDVDNPAIDEMLLQLARYQGQTVLRHQLHRMPEQEGRQLVRAMLDASDDLTDAVVARAGGNPMHITQLVRYLVDERMLEWSASGWRARAGVDVHALLPPSLADVVELRIAQVEKHPRLGETVRALLDRSAVLGRSFRFRVLERMLRIENRADLLESVDEAIDRLLDEDLLQMQERKDDDILSFPTSLIRDVVLARLENRRTTRKLHLHAAEAKLAVVEGGAEKMAGELARHFAAAHDRSRELEYTRLAGEVAERSHRPHDATRFYELAIELLQNHPDLPESAEQMREMRVRAGQIRVGLGEYGAARDAFEAVASDPDAPSLLRVEALYGLGELAWIAGEFEAALARVRSGLAVAQGLGDVRLLARGQLDLARVEWHRGNNQAAQRMVGEALSFARASGDELLVAETTWLLGDLARGRGDIPEAEVLLRQALDRFTTLDRPRGIAKSLSKLAVIAKQRGDHRAAIEFYNRALEIYQTHGGRRGMAHQFNGLGDVARFRGDLALAAENYRRAVDIFQDLELPYDAAIALTNLGLTARDDGRLDEARDALERALRVARRIDYPYLTLGASLNLAHVHALQGNLDACAEQEAESRALADEVELVDSDYAWPFEQLGEMRYARGEFDDAVDLLRRASRMWHELGRTDGHDRVEARLAEIAARRRG